MNYNSYRRKTNTVAVGKISIGGTNPIAIQSMLNTDSHDAAACLKQALELQKVGCDIIRLAIPDLSCAKTIAVLKDGGVTVPLVADIHFDYRIALEAVAAGVDKIRINPGNIGADDRVRAVVRACREKHVPIRIGVNSGSVEKHILQKFGAVCPQALAESALYHAKILEQCDFDQIVLSAKASDVRTTVLANEILAQHCSYPLHLGVTEAGTAHSGMLKSAAGIGALLTHGIGDTIRVSLTADPKQEVLEAQMLLRALECSTRPQINLVSCPTCGRTQISLIEMVGEFERRMDDCCIAHPIRVAMMGCVVNGPGEAREADIGIAGGKDEALLFCRGEPLYKVPAARAVDALIDEINHRFGTSKADKHD